MPSAMMLSANAAWPTLAIRNGAAMLFDFIEAAWHRIARPFPVA